MLRFVYPLRGYMLLCGAKSDNFAPIVLLGRFLAQPEFREPHRLRGLLRMGFYRALTAAPPALRSAFRAERGRGQPEVVQLDLVAAFERIEPSRKFFVLGVVVENFVSGEA